ncbi:MAG: hypothetical protein F6K26_26170 [Moorea sp. SIO2I5]|nr:hypothetical protein [Moorena sp. SIO2I5]
MLKTQVSDTTQKKWFKKKVPNQTSVTDTNSGNYGYPSTYLPISPSPYLPISPSPYLPTPPTLPV